VDALNETIDTIRAEGRMADLLSCASFTFASRVSADVEAARPGAGFPRTWSRDLAGRFACRRGGVMRSLTFGGLLFVIAVGFAAVAPSAFGQATEVADLAVLKTGPDIAAADTDVSFTIGVANNGPDPAANAAFTDPLPAGMTYVSLTSPAGFSCTTPAAGASGTVSCSIAVLGAGSTATFTLVAHIGPGTPNGTFFTNIATVSTDTFDPNSENDSSTAVVSTPPAPTADLGIQKTAAEAAGPDTDLQYTITFVNGGPDAATSASFTDTLPGTMTFVSLSQSSGPPMSCVTPAVGAGGSLTCSAATFPAGSSAVFTLTGHVPAGTPSGTSFFNTASVASSTFDPNSENDSAATTSFVSQVDLSVTKSGPSTSVAGGNVVYAIAISNGGPDVALNAAVTDVLPPPTTFVSLTQNTGPAATCTTPAVGANGTVACTFPLLVPGATAQFTLTLNAASALTIVNTATAGSSSFDTNPSNDSASSTSAVTQSADVSVVKTAPNAIGGNTPVTYTLTVTDAGPSDAASVVLTDVLPASLVFVSLQQTGGSPFTCTTPAVGAGGSISCTAALLAAGSSASFALATRLANPDSMSVGTVVTNAAAVVTTTTDPNSANNSATATSMVASLPSGAAAIPALSPLALAALALALGTLAQRRMRGAKRR
jgi:uncharacterized repeat protein (TIGR01451 family)